MRRRGTDSNGRPTGFCSVFLAVTACCSTMPPGIFWMPLSYHAKYLRALFQTYLAFVLSRDNLWSNRLSRESIRLSPRSRGAQGLQWSLEQLIERQLLEELLRQNLSTPKIAARSGVANLECNPGRRGTAWAAFGTHGKGRRVKSRKERARDMVREVNTHRGHLRSRGIAYKGCKCIPCGYDRCNTALVSPSR